VTHIQVIQNYWLLEIEQHLEYYSFIYYGAMGTVGLVCLSIITFLLVVVLMGKRLCFWFVVVVV
jgi:hypothetical protein